MAQNQRTIEIWDNYWKELPTLIYLLFMLSIAAQIVLSFQGAMMLFGSFALAIPLALVVGLINYILSYLIIKSKADRNHGTGFAISLFLVLPYAAFVFLGGMALCNENGFRDAQLIEFSNAARVLDPQKRSLENTFALTKSQVAQEVMNQCRSCRSADDSKALQRCTGTAAVLDCHNFNPRVEVAVSAYVDETVVAGNALDDLNDLEDDLEDLSLGSRMNQYVVQSSILSLDSLLRNSKVQLQTATSQFGDCAQPSASYPDQFSAGILTFDCSNYNDVFCKGWGVMPFLVLLMTLLGGLLAPLYTQGWSKWQPQAPTSSSAQGNASNS